MSKQITPAELATIVTNLLCNPAKVGELDSTEKFGAFMTDIAKTVCDHCGGQVIAPADNSFEDEWLVGIHGNDSLPPDGGIWREYDPEGDLDIPNPVLSAIHNLSRERAEDILDEALGVATIDDTPIAQLRERIAKAYAAGHICASHILDCPF